MKANLNLQQLGRSVTAITYKDRILFERFFDLEKPSYGNSFLYISQCLIGQGKNNLGYKYYDKKNLSGIGLFSRKEFKTIDLYWIRPMGKEIVEIISYYAKKLKEKYNIHTIVKKCSKIQLIRLKTKGFKDIINYPWNPLAPKEDDTFPERIIVINKLLKKNNHRLKRAMQYYRKFSRDKEIIEKDIKNNESIAFKLIKKFFHSNIPKLNLSNEHDYRNLIFSKKDKKYFGKFYIKNNIPEGLFIAYQINKKYANLYANFSLRKLGNSFSDYLILRAVEILKQKGIQYLNLGGSETINLDNFKKKFSSKTNLMYWCYY